jgi:hypothetical protein
VGIFSSFSRKKGLKVPRTGEYRQSYQSLKKGLAIETGVSGVAKKVPRGTFSMPARPKAISLQQG